MGKSHEIGMQFGALQSESGSVLFRNLRQYDSTQSLKEDLFLDSEFQRWASGDGSLTLALDSLDEALLEIGVLATWLVNQLQRYPTDRLRLRIACRTAHWPQVVEDGLCRIWPGDQFGVFELAPLTAAEVVSAAVSRDLDPAAFMAEVARHDAAGLAGKPTTLRFLLDVFARHEALPETRTDLYALGCLLLCEEDEERRVSRRAGRLTPDERLAVARRIAAATVFGNRAAIWRGADPSAAPSAELPRSELIGGSEPGAGGNRVTVTLREIEETLGTGLFSGRAGTSLGWAHQTYAEFLAAQWVVANNLSLPQIESLIKHPDDPDGRFIPQLKETIAWLAGLHDEVRTVVLATEPDLLLQSDTERLTDEARAAVIDALLDATARGELRWPPFGSRRRYERLVHPGAAEQLARYALDRSQPIDVRELAIEIGRYTGGTSIAGPCADIAMNVSEPLVLRVEAARLVAALGDAQSRRRLLPLAVEPKEDDKEDDLKGTALRAVWPDHLDADGLFAALTFPKVGNRSGSYDAFLSELASELHAELLPTGLRWATEAVESLTQRGSLAAAIVRAAWEHIQQPEILAPFTEYAVGCLAGYRDLLPGNPAWELGSPDAWRTERRRLLVRSVVDAEGEKASRLLVNSHHTRQSLVVPDDLDWLLEQASAASASNPVGAVWAALVRELSNLSLPEDFERVYAHRSSPHISDVFSRAWKPVLLQSSHADALRQEYAEYEKTRLRYSTRPPTREVELPSADRVRELLSGEADPTRAREPGEAWFAVAQELMRTVDGSEFHLHRYPDGGPTWELLGVEAKDQVLAAAHDYIRDRAGSAGQRTAEGKQTWGTWAGYKAFQLLEAQAPGRLDAVPRDAWEAWAPFIVAERGDSNDERRRAEGVALLGRTYAAAPGTVLEAVRVRLLAEDDKDGTIWSLNDFEPLWDERFGAAMLALLQGSALNPNSVKVLLGALLDRNVDGAVLYARSLLSTPLPRQRVARTHALAAAEALLLHAPADGWSVLKSILRRPGTFRRDLALASGHRYLLLDRYSEDQLADIFAWLTAEFPYPDPWYVGMHSPGPEDEARRWRGDAIRALEARTTPAGTKALKRLRREFPELEWLSQTILRAKETLRRDTWQAPGVGQIIALSESSSRRLVESGGQLMGLVLESLERYQGELQGELPAVSALWDNLGHGKYRPKDEQELSDAIARHLRSDLRGRGVVVGREVVIRRGGAGGVPGHRTDIYVTAARGGRSGDRSTVTVILEVKGSWHDELLTAMETQLAGDYLARNPECQHGLYVVGWYLCSRWKDDVGKRRTRRHRSAEELASRLSAQAESLSSGDRIIRAFVLDAAWR
jgi:hypothetical protein